MNTIKDLYYELGKTYEVEWNNDDFYSFKLFFEGKRGRKYKLYISEEYICILKRIKFFRWQFWVDLTHSHYDFEDNTIDDVFDGVQYYLNRYQ